VTQEKLTRKKDIILGHELIFANEIGAILFEKPKVSYWMIFIPILFLYFIFRMQKFKNDRIKFSEEFMSVRREAMKAALDASASDGSPDMNITNRYENLPEPLQKPYASWIKTLSAFYLTLLAADGHDFESLARKAYRNKSSYQSALEKLNHMEKEFYTALKPMMTEVEGTAAIIAKIESASQRLRTESAIRIFN